MKLSLIKDDLKVISELFYQSLFVNITTWVRYAKKFDFATIVKKYDLGYAVAEFLDGLLYEEY